jgi:hypothetical protein
VFPGRNFSQLKASNFPLENCICEGVLIPQSVLAIELPDAVQPSLKTYGWPLSNPTFDLVKTPQAVQTKDKEGFMPARDYSVAPTKQLLDQDFADPDYSGISARRRQRLQNITDVDPRQKFESRSASPETPRLRAIANLPVHRA